MRTLRALAVSIVLASPGATQADTFTTSTAGLPNPPGCAGYTTNDTGEASAACDDAIAHETDPKAKSMLLFRRAFIEDAPGDFKKYPAALADLDLAIKLFPDNRMALHERAYIYVEYGRWSEALADLNAQIALLPDDGSGYSERAIPRFKLGDLQGAYDDRDADIRLRGPTLDKLRARARAAMWLGRFDDAKRDLAASGVSEASDALGRQLALWQDNSGGRKTCELTDMPGPEANDKLIGDCTIAFLAAKTPADRSAALTVRAVGWLQLAHDQDAHTADLEVAAALDPGNANVWANLGFAYMQQRHSTMGATMFDRSIALRPSFIAYGGRAAARLNIGDIDGAEGDAQRSNAIQLNELAMLILGDVAFARTKTYDKAKEFWLKAWQLGSRDDRLRARLHDAGVDRLPGDTP